MKTIKVEVQLFEKGDRILTPCGEATVVENQIFNQLDPCVKVLFDKRSSDYPNGDKVPVELDSSYLTLLKD